MLVSKVTKATFDVMPAVLQEHYTPADAAHPEGDYLIQTDEIKELRNAKAREVVARQQAETALASAIAERNAKTEEFEQFKKDNPDKAATESATQARIATAVKEATDKAAAAEAVVAKAKAQLEKTVKQVVVHEIIAGLTAPEDAHLLELAVEKRIRVDVTGDEPKITFLDDAGLDTVETKDSFRQGVADDKKFAKIVVGSKATGGGAAGGAGQGGSGAGVAKKFADMNEVERTQLYRTNPTEFARLSAAHAAATTAASASKTVLIR